MHKWIQVDKKISSSGWGAQEDNCAGIISNRTQFSFFNEQGPYGFSVDEGGEGLFKVTIKRLYVPSLKESSQGLEDVNFVTRAMTLSALSNWGGLSRPYGPIHTKVDNREFTIKSINVEDSHVYPDRAPDYFIWSTGADASSAAFNGDKIVPGFKTTVDNLCYYYDPKAGGKLAGTVKIDVDDINVNIVSNS